ncbi:hypothetical protein HY025_00170 [Candidatus Daviesbacteria bacterium]|nr:hypothetical protein [Candidatus Daviesbacteria bacterium]
MSELKILIYKKIIKKSLVYFYFVLSILLLSLVVLLQNSPHLQIDIVMLSAIIYITIAMLHHYFDKSLTLEVIIEYILMAALVIIILQGQSI